jgi:hypothetical protein
MDQSYAVDIGPIKELLRQVARSKARELDALFDRLSPVCEIDRSSERILFQAESTRNLIRVGAKCTLRLHAHALAAGVVLSGFNSTVLKEMSPDARRKFFAPADRFLNWAIGRDLQQRLKEIDGYERDLATVYRGVEGELPDELFASLERTQRLTGEMLFRFALAFILLHELGHLHYAHRRELGYLSIQQEKDADWFAAEWLLDAASNGPANPEARRLHVLFGISIALLWLTVFNVFLGRSESSTHPEGYDRLYQVLDRGIDPFDDAESPMVWYFVSTLLVIHMNCAGFELRPEYFQTSDSRDEANTLIDVISKRSRRDT